MRRNRHDAVKTTQFPFYGYVITAVATGTIALSMGTVYSFGLFLEPLMREFGWTKARISGAYSLYFVLHGLFYIVAGRLNDRWGPRMVVTACGCVIGTTYMLMGSVTDVWHLYLLFGVMLAVGMSGIYVPLVSTIARWFVKRRGLMTGLAVAGVGIGTMVMPPLIRGLIATYQWRTTFVILGAAVFVILIPGAQLLKATPDAVGLRPYGFVKDEANNPVATYLGADLQSVSLRHALKTGAFWILCALYATFLFSQQVAMVHIPSHSLALGFSPAVGAMVLSIIGGASLAGRISVGGLGDRVGHATALSLDLGLVLLAFLWLPFATEPWMLFVFAGIFGVGYGGVVVLVSPMLAELFGLRSLGAIFGSVTFLATLGGSLGPVVAGHIFDVAGSYRTALWACTCLVGMSLGGAFVLLSRWRRAGGA